MAETASLPARDWTTGTYAELRRAAAARLQGERAGHTLAPTELVHEAWLRLTAAPPPPEVERARAAAQVMRAVLVDHARRRTALKRGGGRRPLELEEARAAEERDAYVERVDEALRELEARDPDLARVVELRFFGGFGTDEIARVLALSPRTVKRRWQLAKAWLHRRVTGPPGTSA